jgi:FkbM family methyltransferase
MHLKRERFYLWFNKIFFALFYLLDQGKSEVVVNAGRAARFLVRVNTTDRFVVWEIWNAKIYDDERTPIGEEDTVVDIGAHIGVFAVWAAKLAHRGRVFAYEPSSKNYDLLIRNRDLNDSDNLHIDNKAVAGKRGVVPLYLPAENGVLGSLLHDWSRFKEMVQATTLADLMADNDIEQIDYLKIDVEGAEYDILLDCPSETLAKVRRIVMEYHEYDWYERSHLELVEALASNGFTVVVEGGIFPQKYVFGTGIIKAWRD